MKATIWHNPACGTSRKTLAILEETRGVEVTVIEYLKQAPTATKLAQLYRDAGIKPQQGLRLRGTDAEERGLPDADTATVLAAMAADPKLIERPLVETAKACACAAHKTLCSRFFRVFSAVPRLPSANKFANDFASPFVFCDPRLALPHDQHPACPRSAARSDQTPVAARDWTVGCVF
jgi:arsenate reductase (glutaredoxin)